MRDEVEQSLGQGDEIPEMDVSDIVIPGVDAELGCTLCGGELDIFVSALWSFVINIPVTIEKLRTVSEETLSQYLTIVHGLKGSCASIGAEDVRKKAYDLEMKSKAGNLDAVLTLNKALIEEVEHLIKDIQAWFNKKNIRL
ncbi:MAG: Hpt domain-containing protein [Treponema sp.]|jgi:HPt (histidine-containing phosphotransfer) domain-containing protein|nr:Hpt domain-containing protein [Treponema sp.]